MITDVMKIRKHDLQKYRGISSVFLIRRNYSSIKNSHKEYKEYYLQLKAYPNFIVPFATNSVGTIIIAIHAYEIESIFNRRGKVNKQSIMFGSWKSHCIQFNKSCTRFIPSLENINNEKKRVEILVKIIEIYIETVGLNRYINI